MTTKEALVTENGLEDSGDGLVMKGFLMKLGARWKTWKKRWFVIRKGSVVIEYLKSQDEKESPQGTIDLASITSIDECDNNFNLKKEKGEWAFQIVTGPRTYYIFAPDESTMRYWIVGLRELTKRIHDGSCFNTLDATVPADIREQIEGERPQYGQLFVNIKEAIGLPLSKERGHLGVYCVLTLEKQMVKTQVVTDFLSIRWNEGFFFDVTQLERAANTELVISVWAQDISRDGGQFMGQLSIPMNAVYHQKPVDSVFKLKPSSFASSSVHGSLHLKLIFTNIYRKVGVEDFELLKVVGRGNFGKVMQVRKKDTGRIYAMKVLRKDTVIAADAVQHTLSESNVLKRLAHPFIVNLKYSFQTDKKLYMILDYLSGGELFYHLSNVDRFSESRARFYAAEIVLALGYLHENNVIYRDLKPENLLLDITGHVCLTDFGLVKEGIKYGDKTHTFCGSPEYLAPEILLGEGYGRGVDWWALGTFLYEMLEGLPPFYDEEITEMNRRILSAPLYFNPEHFTAEAKSLLRGLLQRDPKLRLGCGPGDAEEIKAHPFFKSVDWEKMYTKGYEPQFKPHLQSIEDVRYFDPEFTSQTPKDSYVESSHLTESKQSLFDGFSYVSTSSFEQLIKQRRKVGGGHNRRLNTPSEVSTSISSSDSDNTGATSTASSFVGTPDTVTAQSFRSDRGSAL